MGMLNKVYSKIDDENIKIFNHNIPFKSKAVTIESDDKYGIFVDYDRIDSTDEEFIIMAHEYGHCKSGATHKIGSKYDIIERHEYRADRKSILAFLPVKKLKEAFLRGLTKTYEIAEYLDLPEEFVDKAIEHYKCMDII